MTVDERRKVESLARRIFPKEAQTEPLIKAPRGSINPWEARLWGLYDALIVEGML